MVALAVMVGTSAGDLDGGRGGDRNEGGPRRTDPPWGGGRARLLLDPPSYLTPTNRNRQTLLGLDGDLPRPGRLRLGQVHGQHAALHLGRDPRVVDALVDAEGPVEVAAVVLVQQVPPRLLFRLHPPVQDQLSALVPEVNVLRPHAGQVGQEHQLLVGLVNVHAWREEDAAAGRFRGRGRVAGPGGSSQVGHVIVSFRYLFLGAVTRCS